MATTVLFFFLTVASTSYAQVPFMYGGGIPTRVTIGPGAPVGGGDPSGDTVPFTAGVPLPGVPITGSVPWPYTPPAGTGSPSVPFTGWPPASVSPPAVPTGTSPYTGSPTTVPSPPADTTPYTGSPTVPSSPAATVPATGSPSPIVGCSCFFWATQPRVWPPFLGAFSSTVQGSFGGISSHFFSSKLTLMSSLRSASADPYAFLLREGTAALLNAYTRPKRFPYTAQYIKARVNTALASRRAAAVQAAKFAQANFLYGAGCKVI